PKGSIVGRRKKRLFESATPAPGSPTKSWKKYFSLFTGLTMPADGPREELDWVWRLRNRRSGCTGARCAHPTCLRVGYWLRSVFLCRRRRQFHEKPLWERGRDRSGRRCRFALFCPFLINN